MKKFVQIDKENMKLGYEEMAEINLEISRESFVAETEGEMINEMVAEKGYGKTS